MLCPLIERAYIRRLKSSLCILSEHVWCILNKKKVFLRSTSVWIIFKASIGILLQSSFRVSSLVVLCYMYLRRQAPHTHVMINLRSGVIAGIPHYHIARCVTGFRILCQLGFLAGFQSLRDSGLWFPKPKIPDSTSKHFSISGIAIISHGTKLVVGSLSEVFS